MIDSGGYSVCRLLFPLFLKQLCDWKWHSLHWKVCKILFPWVQQVVHCFPNDTNEHVPIWWLYQQDNIMCQCMLLLFLIRCAVKGEAQTLCGYGNGEKLDCLWATGCKKSYPLSTQQSTTGFCSSLMSRLTSVNIQYIIFKQMTEPHGMKKIGMKIGTLVHYPNEIPVTKFEVNNEL